MQVQNIQNNTSNFYGRVAIIGKLGEIPARCVEKNKQKLSDLLYPKSFDLYIKENTKDNFVELTVAKPAHYRRKNKPHVNYKVHTSLIAGKDSRNMILMAAKEAVEDYSKIKQPPTLREKTWNFLNKAMERFMKVFQDEDEV